MILVILKAIFLRILFREQNRQRHPRRGKAYVQRPEHAGRIRNDQLDAPGAIAGDATAQGDYLVQMPSAYKAPLPVSKPPAAASAVDHFSEFDIASPLRDDIAEMLHHPNSMHSSYTPTIPSERKAYEAFIAQRNRLGVFFIESGLLCLRLCGGGQGGAASGQCHQDRAS